MPPDAAEHGERDRARRQADARGVPADIMLPRVILVVATVLLSLIGLVMGFSASSIEAISLDESIFSYVGKQAVLMGLGGAMAFCIARFVPYDAWKDGPAFWAVWGLAVLLVAAVPFVGTQALGATRWIYIGSFSLQPSEFAKIVFVIAAARILFRYRSEFVTLRQAAIAAAVLVVLPLAFLYKTQSDMGSAIIVLMGAFAVLWIGEVPLRAIVPLFLVIVAVGAVGMVGYRADRVSVWLDPWSDMYGTGYQVIRSFYAFAEGGIFGVGLGNSREKFQYLSEAETDFIFSIVGEELGLIGAIAVIALFLAVLYAGLRIAHRAPDSFGATMAGGLTVMLVGQAFLNMACVTGLFPVTGKPLPFISSGGSSVLASLIIVGLILSVSVGSNTLTPYERRRNDLNVIRVEGSRRARASGQGARDERQRRSSARDAGASRGAPARARRAGSSGAAYARTGRFAGARRAREASRGDDARAARRARAGRRVQESERRGR